MQGAFGVEQAVVDNFVVTGAGQSITNVCWWGVLLSFSQGVGFSKCSSDPPAGSPFNITYYPDDGNGAPDTANALATISGVAPTARTIIGLNLLDDVYEYTLDHAPVPVADGATIWVEIQHAGDDACVFLWLNSPGAADDIAYQDQGAGYIQLDNDFAFKVDVDALAPLPPASP